MRFALVGVLAALFAFSAYAAEEVKPEAPAEVGTHPLTQSPKKITNNRLTQNPRQNRSKRMNQPSRKPPPLGPEETTRGARSGTTGMVKARNRLEAGTKTRSNSTLRGSTRTKSIFTINLATKNGATIRAKEALKLKPKSNPKDSRSGRASSKDRREPLNKTPNGASPSRSPDTPDSRGTAKEKASGNRKVNGKRRANGKASSRKTAGREKEIISIEVDSSTPDRMLTKNSDLYKLAQHQALLK